MNAVNENMDANLNMNARRLKVVGEPAFYHATSSVVGKQFLLGKKEKEKFLQVVKRYSDLYFVTMLGFAVMDNHFHLLFRMDNGDKHSDDEVRERFKAFHGKNYVEARFRNLAPHREKLGNLSEYMRGIKHSFSWWYNRTHDRRGYFWSDRFNSVLIGSESGLLNCMAYIDLNPVRAGIVGKPEDYRWCSLAYHVGQGNKDGFLSFENFFDETWHKGEIEKKDKKEIQQNILTKYRAFVYDAGVEFIKEDLANMDKKMVEKERKRNFKLPRTEIFAYRCRYFTDSMVLGSAEFIDQIYQRFAGTVFRKKERKAHQTGIAKDVFSLRKLRTPG